METRTTARFAATNGEPEKGALYAAAHVRLAKDIALAVEVEGLPDVRLAGALAPLGGEGRCAWIEVLRQPITLPPTPELARGEDGILRYTVIHMTPADLGDDWPGPHPELRGANGEALPGRVVSACLGRAARVGGWDSIGGRPLPLRPLIPAGSVWFMATEAADADAIAGWHGQAVGRSTAWGFGRVLIGQWQEFGGAVA